ncbi:class I SAM-dependent methyltransferase [Halovulum marinum]|nr:class I SAM-dependent methyltransferase [Halovulum marinum]
MSQDNSGQREFWSGKPGETWLRHTAALDVFFAPVDGLLLDAAAPTPGEAVLDLGCGAGATSRTFAAAVAPGGSVLGLDLSPLMVERAIRDSLEAGVGNVRFVQGDAADAGLPPAAHDLLVSRFGAMFFADPVDGYRTLRGTLKPGGRIALACWAGYAGNPWFRLPQRIAQQRLGPEAPGDPHAPGPMAFADIARVEAILRAAGYADVRGTAHDLHLTHPGGIDAALPLMTQLGPAGRLLRERDGSAEDRHAIADALRAALAGYLAPDGALSVPARINLFAARRP